MKFQAPSLHLPALPSPNTGSAPSEHGSCFLKSACSGILFSFLTFGFVFAAGGQTLTGACCDNKVWFPEQKYPGSTPPAVFGHAMASHNAAGHQYIVMFGGEDRSGNYSYETWEWSGHHWAQRTANEADSVHPVKNPTARRDHGLAYYPAKDARPGLTILFGGVDADGNKSDTWGWNGLKWKNKTPGVAGNLPGNSPSARQNHAMTYDGINDGIIVFGGNDGTVKNDTWWWNGTTWTQLLLLPADLSPPARQNHAMAYDSDRKVVVLFGGEGENGNLLNDTWEWNGAKWNETPPIQTTISPSPRRNHAMAYASECGRILLFGGETPGLSDEYWEREGTEWTQVFRAINPSARAEHAATFQDFIPNHHQFLVFGGNSSAAVNDTWAWGFERTNIGMSRTDVGSIGTPRWLWKRDLTTRRFSWKKVGKFLNSGPGHHYFEYKTYTFEDPKNTTTSGFWPLTGTYTQERAKNTCNDDFSDALDCSSSSMANNADCSWHSEQTTLFQDYVLGGDDFCNPVVVYMDFYNRRSSGTKRIGTLDNITYAYFDEPFFRLGPHEYFFSPTLPTPLGDNIACRQDRYSTESGPTPYPLRNTIKGKEGRVDTQWTLVLVGSGISAGLMDASGPQCHGGGDGGSACDIQYFEFGQDQSDLRFKLTIGGAGFDSSSFCFYIDADNDSTTGATDYPACGADYRVCIVLSTNESSHSIVEDIYAVEQYDSCQDPAWQPTSFMPFKVKRAQTVLELFVPLAGVGDPKGTYSAWVVSSDEFGTECSTIPNNVCETRMQLARTADSICPRVRWVDDAAIKSQHILAAPVTVHFSERVQPIVAADVQITPPVPFTVNQLWDRLDTLYIYPDPDWKPGKYSLTLLPTIMDLSGNLLDGNYDGVCGGSYTFEFCVPDLTFFTTDASAATPKQVFTAGDNIYVTGRDFPNSTTFDLYLVIDGNVATLGKKLADWSQTGPHTATTDSSGNLSLINLGQPHLAGDFKVVADLNRDGLYDVGDRVTDLCGPGLAYGEPCTNTIHDIVAWWPFEDVLLTTAAELMSANQGTLVGDGSITELGKVGKARFFTGSAYLSVADDSASISPQLNFGTGDFSMEAWIKTSIGDAEMALVDKRSAGVQFTGYYLRLVGGRLSFAMGGLAFGIINYGGVGVNVADGQWNHVGVTVNRSGSEVQRVKLFVNGVVQADAVPVLGSVDNTAELRIGGNRSGDPAHLYIGGVDELELYDRALKPEEMLFIYNQGPAGKCTDAVAAKVTGQLTDGVFRVGSEIALAVSFSTALPLAYQWYLNGVALTNGGTISGVTNNVLIINSATLANAGRYSLVARNFIGEETSQLIQVTVLPPITLQFLHTATNITLLWTNTAYRLQVASDLSGVGSPTGWTNLPGSSPIIQPITGPRKFFRLISP